MLKVDSDQLVKQTAFCNLPYTKLIINAYGGISMCCYQLTQIGNIFDHDILTVWKSAVSKEIRETTSKGELHPVCTSWHNCPFITTIKNNYTFDVDPKYPINLEICLPDKHCNIGGETISETNRPCVMCIRNFRDYSKMPDYTDLICQKSKPLMPFLKYFSILGVAEPFWKDAIFNIFEKVNFSAFKDNITFTTNTNVTCLTEKVIKRFFKEVKYSEISFSLDAATPETFKTIRRLDCFDLVLKNIKNYLKLRNENHKTLVYNNINMLNVKEMSKMVELTADLGVDKMLMLPTHDQAGVVELGDLLLNDNNASLFKDNAYKALEKAKELGVDLHYPKTFDVPSPQLYQIGKTCK